MAEKKNNASKKAAPKKATKVAPAKKEKLSFGDMIGRISKVKPPKKR